MTMSRDTEAMKGNNEAMSWDLKPKSRNRTTVKGHNATMCPCTGSLFRVTETMFRYNAAPSRDFAVVSRYNAPPSRDTKAASRIAGLL